MNFSGRELGAEETEKGSDPRSGDVRGLVARAGVGPGGLLLEQVRSDSLDSQEGMASGRL